ncbi:MAG: S8 family serine peptidase, partial [Pseudomonadota bacterium]|nr:S8 family serine peptidase [Pseudomonadota bacterium]
MALATLLAIGSLTLAACGGGGGGGPTLAAPKSSQTNAYRDERGTRLAGSSQVGSYALAATGAAIAHRANHKGNGVTVAVVDTGVDVNHPDLEEAFDWSGVSDRRTQNPKGRNFVASPDYFVKSDNVRPRAQNLGVASWNIVKPGGMSHGTHVAGIIAARENNEGIVGIAPQANLLPVRWLSDGYPERYYFAPDADPGEPGLENYGDE